MPRFRVIDAQEAKVYDPNEEYVFDEYDDWRHYLLDTKTNEIVYSDGEPEDQILIRDLSYFVDLLNKIDSEDD